MSLDYFLNIGAREGGENWSLRIVAIAAKFQKRHLVTYTVFLCEINLNLKKILNSVKAVLISLEKTA